MAIANPQNAFQSVARNPRAASLLTNLDQQQSKRYQSVNPKRSKAKLNQDSSATLRGGGMPRFNLLKSIHKIEELSVQQLSNVELFPNTLETDPSTT